MYTLQTFEDKANSLTSDKIKVLEFNGVKAQAKFKCLTCGKEQTVSRGEVLVRAGKKYQCQFCHTPKERITLEVRHKIENLCKKNNLELLEYKNASSPVKLKCKKCNKEFTREAQRLLKNTKCPSCFRTGTMSLEKFEEELEKRYGKEYSIVDRSKYTQTHKKILVKHQCGFTWSITPSNLLFHQCPKCSRKTSKGEKAIQNYCEENDINYCWQWQQKIEGKTLYFDFYLPNYKLAIEFQGEQHYIPVRYWGGDEAFEKRKINDQLKRDWCKEKNITLLEIPYTKFQQIENILSSSTTNSSIK